MTPTEYPELQTLRIDVDRTTRDAALEEITRALRATERRTAPVRRNRWATALAVVALTAVPLGAVASDAALPGDALYGIKRTVEPLVHLVDHDVVARHRIEELEALASRGGDPDVVDRLIQDAQAELAELEPGHLADRFDAVLRHIRATHDAEHDVRSTESRTGDLARSTTTTTTATVEPRDTAEVARDAETTTTTPEDAGATDRSEGDSEPAGAGGEGSERDADPTDAPAPAPSEEEAPRGGDRSAGDRLPEP